MTNSRPIAFYLLFTFLSIFLFFSNNIIAQEKSENDLIIEDFGFQIQDEIEYGKTDLIDASFTYDTLYKRMFVNSDDAKMKKFEKEFKIGFEKEPLMGKMVKESFDNAGIYKFISYSEENGNFQILYSAFSGAGINYFNYEVVIG